MERRHGYMYHDVVFLRAGTVQCPGDSHAREYTIVAEPRAGGRFEALISAAGDVSQVQGIGDPRFVAGTERDAIAGVISKLDAFNTMRGYTLVEGSLK